MSGLLRSELLRFRFWIIAVALAHLAALGFLHNVGVLLLPDAAGIGALAYSVLGLALGLVQMSGYRRLSQWAWLVHRPLSPTRIWLALSIAAVLMLAVAVVLPMLLVLAAIDVGSAWAIDSRHYLTPLYVLGLVLANYLVGCYLVLAPSRVAVFALALLPLFVGLEIGAWIFIPQLAVVGLLAWLVRSAFRVDLHSPPQRLREWVPTLLALQWGLFYAAFGVIAVLYQFALMTGNRDPLINPDVGTVFHAQGLEPPALVNFSLGEAQDASERMLRREVEIADSHVLHAAWDRFPSRHQPHFMDRHAVLVDRERNVLWSFSHDHMLFEGRHLQTGADMGWMDATGAITTELTAASSVQRFDAVPRVVPQADGKAQLVLPGEIRQVDFDQQRTVLRHRLAPGNAYRSGIWIAGNRAVAMTEAGVYLFPPRELLEEEGLLVADAVVPFPDDPGIRGAIVMTELVDGHLFTFRHGSRFHGDGWGTGTLHTGYQPLAGEFQWLSTRPLDATGGALFLDKAWIISPLMTVLTRAVWSAIDPQDADAVSLADLSHWSLPPQVLAAMALLALLCAGMTCLLGRRAGMSSRQLLGWSLANALSGVPGVIVFLCLTSWRQSAAGPLRAGAPAHA